MPKCACVLSQLICLQLLCTQGYTNNGTAYLPAERCLVHSKHQWLHCIAKTAERKKRKVHAGRRGLREALDGPKASRPLKGVGRWGEGGEEVSAKIVQRRHLAGRAGVYGQRNVQHLGIISVLG